jgi:uncharacterized protein (TIGR02118 family)
MMKASNMKVRMGLIRKKPDWTLEDFEKYWRDKHGPLVSRAPDLREYSQNLVTERLQRGIDFARGPWDFDGISQLSFDDAEHANKAFVTSDLAAAFVADENHFIGELHVITTERSRVIAVPDAPARGRLLKRMSVLTRRPDITEEEFRREWKVHGDLVRQMRGVEGYRQNVVIEREFKKGQLCRYDQLPMDGIVELWFENVETLANAFASPAGRKTMEHAKTFLSEITAFLVSEHRIV